MNGARKAWRADHYVQPSATPVKHTAGSWKVCTPTNAPDFRAIPYFFGRKLHLELDNDSVAGSVAVRVCLGTIRP